MSATLLSPGPPPGLVVVICGDLGRFTNFAASVAQMMVYMHEESALMWSIGSSPADNTNDGASALIANPRADHMWILGDDHEWDPELYPRMLARMYELDLDILVPLCFRRSWPPKFVIYDRMVDDVAKLIEPQAVLDHLLAGEHTIEIVGAGTGGMLIRRRVLEALDPPWFRNGIVGPDGTHYSQAGEDVNFCTAATAKGFKVHAALDLAFGHIGVVTFAPEMVDNAFGLRMFFGSRSGPFVPLTEPVA